MRRGVCPDILDNKMRVNLSLVAFAALFTVSTAISQDALKAAIISCYPTDGSVPAGRFEAFLQSKNIPSNDEEKCFMGCFYRKIGLTKNGGLDTTVARALADTSYKSSPEVLSKAYAVVNTCSSSVKNIQDECLLGYKVRECFVHNSGEIGSPFFRS